MAFWITQFLQWDGSCAASKTNSWKLSKQHPTRNIQNLFCVFRKYDWSSSLSTKQQLSSLKNASSTHLYAAGWPRYQARIKSSFLGCKDGLGEGSTITVFAFHWRSDYWPHEYPWRLDAHAAGLNPWMGTMGCRGHLEPKEECIFVGHRWAIVSTGSLCMHHNNWSHQLPVQTLTNDENTDSRLQALKSQGYEVKALNSHRRVTDNNRMMALRGDGWTEVTHRLPTIEQKLHWFCQCLIKPLW